LSLSTTSNSTLKEEGRTTSLGRIKRKKKKEEERRKARGQEKEKRR
jgi:hypothetical protein